MSTPTTYQVLYWAGCEADGSDVGEEGSVDGSADISVGYSS